MSERRVGIVVVGEKVTLVDAIVEETGPISIQSDYTFKLQDGPREQAYSIFYQQIANYLKEHGIGRVIVKGSALPTGSAKKAHLESAELRGIATAAAASICPTKTLYKASLSKTFGERKVDEYLKDDEFWDENIGGTKLRGGSREAALIMLADRDT